MAIRVPYRPAVSPAQAGPQASAGASMQLIGAANNLAQTVGGIAEGMWKQNEQLQQINNEGKLADLQTQFQLAAVQYETDLAGNNDPSTWVAGLQKKLSDKAQELKIDQENPAIKQAFNKWRAGFEGKQVVNLERDGKLYSIEQARIANNNNVGLAVDRGDYEGAFKLIDGLSTLSPAEKDSRKNQINGIRAKREVESLVISDPKDALEWLQSDEYLKEPGASKELQQHGIKQAKIEFQRKQRESLGALDDDIKMGKFATEKELTERLEKEDYIEEGMRDEVLFHFQQSKPLDQETRFALTDGMNDLHDAYKKGDITMEEYRIAHDGIAQVVYSFGARDGAGALRKRINDLDPAAWNGQELKASGTSESMRTVQRLAKTFEDSGAFGKVTDEEAAKLAPLDLANKRTEIFNTRARLEASMESWLKEHPNATQPDIDAQFKKEYLNNAASTILRPGGAWATEPEVQDYIKEVTKPSDDPKGASSKISTEPIGGNLKEMVKHFEAGGEENGFHEKAYWDYGQWSIGYGTRSKEGEVIDKAEAERRLDSELSLHKKRVLAANENLKLDLKPNEIDALTSFDYNTGSLEKLLNGGTRSKAEIASTMLLYRNAKGKRLPGLERRRIAEATLFRRGYKGERQELATDPSPGYNLNEGDIPQTTANLDESVTN